MWFMLIALVIGMAVTSGLATCEVGKTNRIHIQWKIDSLKAETEKR